MMSKSDFVEKKILFISSNNTHHISFSNDNIIIKDEENKLIHQSSCHVLFAVFIVGNYTLTNVFIDKAKKFNFSIFIVNQSFKTTCAIINGLEGNYLLHKKQYFSNNDSIGQLIIKNKISNQSKLLKKERNKSDSTKSHIEKIDNCIDILNDKKLDFLKIMSIEAYCSKLFFGSYYAKQDWQGRRPRTKMDPLNTSLDIGYTILFNYIDCLLKLYDFDEYVGVFHKEFYKRKSLVCDLEEPFRCIIDEVVRKSFNLKVFSIDDFSIVNNQYILKHDQNSKYSRVILNQINDYKIDIFLYIQSYYRWFMKNKDIEYFPEYKYDYH